ncbi:hypothetical protein DPMN_119187 [Dreissena polymorpha]|uniref:Uncharacterized protein n=1 Tax=Dreissena polymorpha TaxID=45954 RepID=A0A9D4GLE9_DREPO|nr:hypothetical protein DPMN_119187 [Dreissena polymorpha]
MGKHDPMALTRALWWRNNFFGFRGRDEHRKLRWGDITICEEVDGSRYSQPTSLEYPGKKTLILLATIISFVI